MHDAGPVPLFALPHPISRRLCAALGWRDWQDDPSLAEYRSRRRRGREIAARLRGSLLTRTAEVWLDLAPQHDLPMTIVRSHQDVPHDPQVTTRRLFEEGWLQPPIPGDARVRLVGPVGELGADRDVILGGLGWLPGEIASAAAAGAFGPVRT